MQAIPLSEITTDHPDTTCQTSGCHSIATKVRELLDTSFDPCDDFYHFACGNRTHSNIANNIIEFVKNAITISERVRDIIELPSTPDEAKPIAMAKQYYAECMNVPLLEKRGLIPLQQLIGQFGGWPVVEGDKWKPTANWTELPKQFINAGIRSGLLIDLSVAENLLNPSRHNRIINVSKSRVILRCNELLEWR